MASGIVRAGQPVSVPGQTAVDHAASKDYVDVGLALKADDSAVVHDTGNETIAGQKTVDAGAGNQWIFNQPPQVAVGTLATHAVRRDDTRLTDARTPTTHKASHSIGGGDVLTPADIGASLALVPTASKTAAYTAVSGDLVMCDGTTAFTVTLPAAAAGRVVGIKKTDASANLITYQRAGTDTIGAAGSTSGTLALRDQTVVLQANGTNWVVIHASQPLGALDTRYANANLLTSGIVAAARLPAVRDVPTVLTFGTNPTIDATVGNLRTFTMTADATIGTTIINGVDGQMLRVRATASAAQRILTLAAALIRPSHIASTLTIPSGLRGDIGLFYEAAYGWTVLAAQVA